MAILIEAGLRELESWDVEYTGVDISLRQLERASLGIFADYELIGSTPEKLVEKYFKGETFNFFDSFIRAAFIEEFFKMIVLIFFCTRKDDFDEPMDGLVYGVVVSLGFATYENYTYVYEWAEIIAKEENVDYAELSYLIALGRSYSAIPMHGLNGAVMGYYFGMYAFTGNKKFLVLSLALPYLFHGFYNFLVWPNPMIIIGILAIFSFYLHIELKNRQKLKKKEEENKII